MKFGLRNITSLLRSAGSPHQRFRSIHIAGTNGKGSTAAFLASMFTEAGYKTGLYTSPHLVHFTERIRIDGRKIPERRLVTYTSFLRRHIERVKATFFEATTCVAFMYFADEGVDIAIVETGLGGRLDATNTLTPVVSVITGISRDHTEHLGNSLESITKEKGGIIKPGVPCVTGVTEPHLLRILKSIATHKGTSVYSAQRLVRLRTESGKRDRITLLCNQAEIKHLRLGLSGTFQHQNARVALAAVSMLLRNRRLAKEFHHLSPRAIQRGLERVVRNTGLRGRLELVRWKGRSVLLDVAHNPDAVAKLVGELRRNISRDLIVVLGVMGDKEYGPMVKSIGKVARRVIAVAASTDRALKPHILFSRLQAEGILAVHAGSVTSGLRMALRIAKRDDLILVTGSHFVVGETLGEIERGRT
jgi:dihydrofolate synthase/folylpolyglutamate synthase